MTINPLDRSNYFRGLLVLAGYEKNITENKKEILKKVANILGFNHHFIDKAIEDFFENDFIIEEPPVFSDFYFAETFIKDGIRISLSDKILKLDQIEWLSAIAAKNNLSRQWFFIELENFLENYSSVCSKNFEIQKYLNHKTNDNSFVY
jgi:hypothetical protein